MRNRKLWSMMLVVTLIWQLLTSTFAFAATTSTATILNKVATLLGNNEYNVELTIDKKITRDPYDIVLVFDRTGSMASGNALETAKVKTNEFIDDVLADNPANRFAVVSFSTSATTETSFTSNATLLKSKINALQASGTTNIRSGLDDALTVLQDSDKQKSNKIVILLTDGVANNYNGKVVGNLTAPPADKTDAMKTVIEPINATLIGGHKVTQEAEFFSIGLFQGLRTRTAYDDDYAGTNTYGYFWNKASFADSYVDTNELVAEGKVTLDAVTNKVTQQQSKTYNKDIYVKDDGTFSDETDAAAVKFNVDLPIVYNTTNPSDLSPFVPAWWAEDELGKYMLKEATPDNNFYDIYTIDKLYQIYQQLAEKITIAAVAEDVIPDEFTLDETSIKAFYGSAEQSNLATYNKATKTITWKPNLRDNELDRLTYKLKAKDGQAGKLSTNTVAKLTYTEDLNSRKTDYFPVPNVTINQPIITIDETVYKDAARTIVADNVYVGDKLYYKVVIQNDSDQTLPIQYVSSLDLANATVDGQAVTVTKDTPLALGKFAPKATKVVLAEVTTTTATTVNHTSDATSVVNVMDTTVVNNVATNRLVEEKALKVSDATSVLVVDKTATITTKFLEDKTNKELAPTVTKSEKVGETYNAAKITIPSYAFVRTDGEPTGKTPEGGVTVTHYYVKTAPMNVQYLLKDAGTELKDTLQETANVGDDYNYTPPTISGYQYLMKVGQSSGKVPDGGATIQFYYVQVAPVTVSYFEKGTTNAILPKLTEEKEIGTTYKYDTRPEVKGYTFDSATNNTSGTVTKDGVNIILYYNKVIPTAVVNLLYIDKATDKPIADEERRALPIGDDYKYESKPITNYTFKDATGVLSGKVPADGTTIVFYYEKTKVTAKVRYIDETTKAAIAADETITDEIGKPYTTTAKGIAGYSIVTKPANATGTYALNMTDIIYVYRRDVIPTPTPTPVPTPNPAPVQATVTVKFIDASTKQSLTSDVTKTGAVGTAYETTPVTISEYELVTTPVNAKGTFTAGNSTVTYEYKKVAYGSVVVKYVDSFTRQAIAPEVITRDIAGKAYTSKPVVVAGYQLVATPKGATGTIATTTTTVVYEYNRLKGEVTVRHIDEQTKKPLAADTIFNGYYETSYATTPETFAGYKLVRSTGSLAGKFSETAQTVVYYYRATIVLPNQTTPGNRPDFVEGRVTVKYIDATTKKPIVKPTTMTKEVGTSYKTTAKSFTGFTLTKVAGATSGKVVAKGSTVTYYYKANVKTTSTTSDTTKVNESGATLPVTGEETPWMNYAAGAAMMMMAFALTMRRRRA